MLGEIEKPVFNVLELFEGSGYGTWRIGIRAGSDEALRELQPLSEQLGIEVEDWTAMRILCRQCSEGHPHEQHDHDGDAVWQHERSLGVAALAHDAVAQLSASTLPAGLEIVSVECVVAPGAERAPHGAG